MNKPETVEKLFEDAWAKAMTLKAQKDISAIDPERTLFLDCLATIPAQNIYRFSGQLRKDMTEEHIKIFDYLATDKADAEHPHAKSIENHDERLSFLHDIASRATNIEDWPDIAEGQRFLAHRIQSELNKTDEAFAKWIGNPFELK